MSIFTAMWQAVQACFARCLGRPGGSSSKGAGADPGADPGATPARRELEARGNQRSSRPAAPGWLVFLGGIQAAALVMSARPAGRGKRCPRCGAPLSWAGEFQIRQTEG